jgi:release factor glutamine methyltransferase
MTDKNIWTIQKILSWTTQHFMSKNIPSSRLDAEILLAHILKCRRLDLYLRFDQPLKESELINFKGLVIRRLKHEPVAYIIGEQEFYGRKFVVGPGALIPRPETEQLVDAVIAEIKSGAQEEIKILDVGTGTGCIGITLANENQKIKVTALEKDSNAFKFAAENAKALSVSDRFSLKEVDFSEFEEGVFDFVVSNPPYIGRKMQKSLQRDVVDFEPDVALFGGAEGHELFVEWLPKFAKNLKGGGKLFCEIGYDQGEILKKITEEFRGFDSVEVLKDYSGRDRILRAARK